MQQIRFRLGLCPRPRWRSLQCSFSPYLDLRGLLLREGRKDGRETQGRGEKGEGRGHTFKARGGKKGRKGEETVNPQT